MKSEQAKDLTLDTASFFLQFSFLAVALTLVYYLRERFALDPAAIGVLSAVLTASSFTFNLLLEGVLSRFRPYIGTEFGVLSTLTGVIILYFSQSVALCVPAIILVGMGEGAVWPQIMGWITRGKEGTTLNNATSYFNFSWSFAAGLAPLATGLLVQVSVNLSLIVAGATLLGVFVFLALSTNSNPTMKNTPSQKDAARAVAETEDHSTPLRFPSWAGMLLIYAVFGVFNVIFPLYVNDVLGLREGITGTYLAVRGFITCAFFIYVGRVTWWQFKKKWIVIFQGALGIIMLLGSTFTTAAEFWIFFPLYGICFAFIYSMSLFHGTSGAKDRAFRSAIHEAMVCGGQIIGSSVGGAIYQSFGFREVLIGCAAVCFLFVLAELIFVKPKRSGTPVGRRLAAGGTPVERKIDE